MEQFARVQAWTKVEPQVESQSEIVVPDIKNHTATLVDDHILVFGGYNGHSNSNDLYDFDCKTLKWKKVQVSGKIPKGRNGHTATYADGKLFVVGGWLGAGPLAASDLYVLDLANNVWLKPETYGNPPGACNMHTTDYVKELRSLFVFRGGDGRRYLNELHILNIDTLTWSQGITNGPAPAPRANHSSALIGTNLYIFGGWDGTQRLNEIHVLCTKTLTWSSPTVSGYVPSKRAGMSLTAMEGRLYLFGGSGPRASCFSDLQVFDPETNTWLVTETVHNEDDDTASAASQGVTMKQRPGGVRIQRDHALSKRPAASVNGVRGEFPELSLRADNPNATTHKSPAADVVLKGSGPSARAGHTATLVGRKLVIYGGSCVDQYLNDMFILDTDVPPKIDVYPQESAILRMQNILPRYLTSGAFSDVTFLVEGRRIPAHKMILSMASERFERMFKIDNDLAFIEAKQGEVEIVDVSFVAFQKMLEYLYTGRLSVLDDSPADSETEPNSASCGALLEKEEPSAQFNDPGVILLVEILGVSDRFMLDHLKQLCEQRLAKIISKHTVDLLLEEADLYNASQLRNLCYHFKRQVER